MQAASASNIVINGHSSITLAVVELILNFTGILRGKKPMYFALSS